MTATDPIVICSARRTPLGAFTGALASVPAPMLGATAIAAAIEDGGFRTFERERHHDALRGLLLAPVDRLQHRHELPEVAERTQEVALED